MLDRRQDGRDRHHEELLAQDGIYANLYRMTYEQEKAAESEGMVGEDEAFARRRQGEMAEPLAGA